MAKLLARALVVLTLGAADAVFSGHGLGLLRGSSLQADPVPAPWTPPPAYQLGTVGHKTMYLVDVAIGASGQTFRLLVDTGSPTMVVPGATCQRRSNRFDASAARPANKTMSVQYGMGTVSGRVFEDRVCVQVPNGAAPLQEVGFLQQHAVTAKESGRGTAGDNPGQACASISFLVADKESDDFATEPFDGILGLGLESSSESRSSASLQHGFSLLSQLAEDGSLQSTAFALRLGNSGASQLLLGGVDEAAFAGGRAVWVPLSLVEDGSWQFTIQDLTLDGQAQNFGGLQVAVDSGTSLVAADKELGQWLRTHLTPSDCNAVDHLPKLGLSVGGGSVLSLLPADYVDQEGGECKLALMPSPLQSASGQRLLLGDSFLRRYVTVYDRQNQRLGFGVAADDGFAKELLPGMFPKPTTTAAATTTEGPPPPKDLDYGRLQFAPPTTTPPPTAEDIRAAQTQEDLANGFSGLGDDLAGSFDALRKNAMASLGSAGPTTGTSQR